MNTSTELRAALEAALDDIHEPAWHGYECPNTFGDGVAAARAAVLAALASSPQQVVDPVGAASERELFEATIGAGRVLVKTEAGEYASTYVQNDWEVWQARAGLAKKAEPSAVYSYASTQATKCAGCGERKHTPLRIDAMGGYVCLTCIDQKLGLLLDEFDSADPDPYIEGGRETVEDALAVVQSFGPGTAGLNDTFARQVLLAAEVNRLRGLYESAVHGRRQMRDGLRASRARPTTGREDALEEAAARLEYEEMGTSAAIVRSLKAWEPCDSHGKEAPHG